MSSDDDDDDGIRRILEDEVPVCLVYPQEEADEEVEDEYGNGCGYDEERTRPVKTTVTNHYGYETLSPLPTEHESMAPLPPSSPPTSRPSSKSSSCSTGTTQNQWKLVPTFDETKWALVPTLVPTRKEKERVRLLVILGV
ncbi:hypothetical protein GYMLUDRAFT_246396 [Collybiopsis luxurians FD-317 M1]|uniref:Uncharacterized protein n=1 Tax=Collybiopsis luxurians FD-317 M1 TaxID=944289 RepID=A0A0D0BS03_9AGAR|nr:hypothetical protein GYMLUDRAFT_246396 [Collybiopsis luxurians FD-317 M1]